MISSLYTLLRGLICRSAKWQASPCFCFCIVHTQTGSDSAPPSSIERSNVHTVHTQRLRIHRQCIQCTSTRTCTVHNTCLILVRTRYWYVHDTCPYSVQTWVSSEPFGACGHGSSQDAMSLLVCHSRLLKIDHLCIMTSQDQTAPSLKSSVDPE